MKIEEGMMVSGPNGKAWIGYVVVKNKAGSDWVHVAE